jgi:aminopeptidase N
VSFNYGSFERLDSQMEDGPALWIYRGKNHRGGLFGGDFKKTVAANIEGAVQLFSEIFQPYPWDHLAATEIPASHGQGFPQLLHLAWISFDTQRKGITDAFIAHEVAHQWFGHIVGWDSYRDQWLSEAFAEYASGLYLQARYPENKEFFSKLKEWSNNVLQRGGRDAWHDGPGVAPIWLGYRCSSYNSPASYQHIVYAKGAYVLHMLRQMLHDYESGSDQRFFWLISDFIERYAGTNASTDDFLRAVESHCHQDMGWFFDQWIYGTQIPRFKYDWDREELPDGRWIVRGRIEQSETDPPFRVYMPITIEFKDAKTTILQEVSGAVTKFETPPLPSRPQDVNFNDFHTVLCRE